MGAPELLHHLRGAGLVLTLTATGGLHVAPRDALTSEHRAAIRAQRDDLVLALQAEAQNSIQPTSMAVATASRWWLIHYPERDPGEVSCTPPATHAAILERHPDAIAAEPFTPTIRQPSAPMTAEEETAIRAWLALIEETDPVTIAEVIGQCQRDADSRDYFTGRAAAELPKPDPDDRRTCSQCANLRQRACTIAKPERGALVVANPVYRPDPARLLRCAGYAPMASDPDQRSCAELWPGLFQKGGE